MTKLNFNFIIADFVSRLNLGILRKLRFIKITKTIISIRLLKIFYKQGIIRTFIIKNDNILVYFKYIRGQSVCTKLSIISKPSFRQYWKLGKLSLNYNNKNFSGFYIISTQQGLVTTEYCLLQGHVSGESIIKVEI